MMVRYFSNRVKESFILFLVIGILYSHLVYASGLSTGFGKVILENIPMGIEYSMRRDSKFPLIIKNKGDQEIELKIEVLVPKEGEIQLGYEAIPEAKWITLEEDSFIVEPNGQVETDVVISIPDNEEYNGRKFHVFIWSRTIGDSLGLGIKSKLLFSVKGM